jgi:hypothetical protein
MTGSGLGRAAAGMVLGAVLALTGCPTKYEPYDFSIRLVFPPGQAPLEDLYSLEMDVEYDSGTRHTFYLQPVTAGNWSLDGIPPVEEGRTVVLRFRGMAEDPTTADNVIEVANGASAPVALGYDPDVNVYFSERHELALLESVLGGGRPALGVVSLPGGGAIVLGGGVAPDGDPVAGVERLELSADGRYVFTPIMPDYQRSCAALHRVDRSASPHHETVLIIGGFEGSFDADGLRAEIDRFDPVAESIDTIFDLPQAMASAELTELGDGRLLLSGGWSDDGDALAPSTTYVLVDPVAANAVAAGQMDSARLGHRGAALQDGSVLVCGGSDGTDDGATLDGCELWSPGGVSGTGAMKQAREQFGMVALPGDPQGRVAAFGGRALDGAGGDEVLDTVELYDPSTGDWSLLGARMTVARASFELMPLPDDRFLVCGGADSAGVSLAECEVFDPDLVAFGPHSTAVVAGGRQRYGVATLDSGLILLAGGSGAEPEKAYLYNP